MAHRHEPVPLVPAVGRHVGVAHRERAACIAVPELRCAVPLGIVGVAVDAVGDEPVASGSHHAATSAIPSRIVGIRLARQACRQKLVGRVEREPARAIRRRLRNHTVRNVVGIRRGNRRSRGRRVHDPHDPPQPVERAGGRGHGVHTGTGISSHRRHGTIRSIRVVGPLRHRLRGRVANLIPRHAVQGVDREAGPRPQPASRLAEAPDSGDSGLVLGGRHEVARLVVREVVLHQRVGHEDVRILHDLQVVAAGGALVARGDGDHPAAGDVGRHDKPSRCATPGCIIEDCRSQSAAGLLQEEHRIKGRR